MGGKASRRLLLAGFGLTNRAPLGQKGPHVAYRPSAIGDVLPDRCASGFRSHAKRLVALYRNTFGERGGHDRLQGLMNRGSS